MQLIKHTFSCGRSPDLIEGNYLSIHRIRLRGDAAWREPSKQELGNKSDDFFTFNIVAPLGASVEMMLMAIADNGDNSLPVRYAWEVTGRPLLRMPGQTPYSLRMLSAEAISREASPSPPPTLVQPTINGESIT